MNVEFFIARRIGGGGVVLRIAVATVAVGMAVMIVSMAVMAGFRHEIAQKIENFRALAALPQKTALIKTGEATQGIVLKGVDADTIGRRELFISPVTARTMKLDVGDKVEILFSNHTDGFGGRRDRFKVAGIFSTGLEEMDKTLAITDLYSIERLGTDPSVWTGELSADYPQLSDWLATHNVNAAVIITIMTLVALISMVSAVLVIVLERIKMIGILKTLGLAGAPLKRIFLLRAAQILGWGLAAGNFVGIALALLQKYTGVVRLDPDGYFLSRAPISLDWQWIVALNVGTIVVILAVMVLPTAIVGRITPEKTLRWE